MASQILKALRDRRGVYIDLQARALKILYPHLERYDKPF